MVQVPGEVMGMAVKADHMTCRCQPLGHFGVTLDGSTYLEERRRDILAVEVVCELRGVRLVGAVIEGEGDQTPAGWAAIRERAERLRVGRHHEPIRRAGRCRRACRQPGD